ncbi:alpha-protein kinase 2 [Ctenodactylus gundi]
MWCERMTDPGGPQGHKLSFLSTLLSQKVPEKSDVVLRCMISGHPKPEVTWYKNGQPVGECGLVSSYEFFAHQYIHVLHLSCCTRSDAAIYQISAKSCLGMICCSASIEVERLSENSQLPPELSDGRDTGWKREAERCGKESPGQSQQREYPYKEEENISPGAPAAADSSSPQLICFHSPQSLSTGDISASGPENLLVEETRQTAEAYDPNNAQDIFLNSIHTSENHNACCHETTPSTISRSLDCGPNDHEPHDGVLTSSHQNSKAQKYISFSLPLQEATACVYPAESTVANKPPSPQVSSEDSDSDYELCPEITLTYTEEFSDDDLEFLECSDVMTDYSNAVWQRSLQGTEHVFLLESDDEEMEFSECVLGGCEYFLSEMGCAPWVSGDTGPMDAPAGFAGYHSQAQEVGVSSSSSFRHSLSSQRTGMTLTVGAHQDGTATVTRQGRCPLLTASEAAENDCPGIQGETRDSHRAGEEFASNNLLTMDKEATEPGMKLSSWGSEESGTKQSLEITAEQSTERKALGSRRGVQKPVRGRRPGAKGKSKKLTLDDRLAPGTLSPPPWGSAECPLALSNQGESPQAKAGAPGWDSQVLAEECAISYPRQQHGKTLQCLAGSLHKEGDADLKEGTSVSNLRETNRTADQSGHPPVQIHETVRERISLSQMPAFSEPAGEESLFTGTTMSSLSNLGGIHKENASSTQYLEIESHPQGSQQGENQDRDGATPCGSWAQPQHELNPPEASDGNGSPDVLSVCLPLGTSAECRESETLSVGSPAPTNTTLTLGNVCSGSRSKEAACVVECFEASDQGTCYDTMDSPVGTSVDKYLLQDICSMDFELTEGQSKVCDLYSPDDKKLAALFQAQGGAPPQSTRDSSKGSNSALPPLFISTFTWTMSQMATKSARGGNLAEVENSTTTWSPTEQAGQDSLSPLDLGRTGEARPLSTENNSFVHFKEGDDERLRASVPVTTDMLACHSSVVKFPQEKPTTLMSSAECLQETKEEESEDTVSEYWKSGKRLKIITLEASVSEIWPLTQVTEPGYKEAEASPIVPDRTLVLPNALKTDTALPQLDLSGLGASASRPQDDIGLALANHRETLEGSVPVHTTQWSSLSSKYLSQPRFLEPSVDPVDKKELWATDSSKSSKNEQKDNVNSLHQDQEDSQMSCAAFFTRFLTFPRILESSVDPIDGTDWMECPVAEKPGPFEPTPGTSREGRKSTSGNSGQTAKGQPAILQVPHPQDSGETIPDGNGVSQDQGDIEIEEAQQSQRSEGKAEVQAAIKQAPCPDEGVQRIPRAGSLSHLQNGRNRNSEEAGHGEKDEAESVSPPSPSTSCLAVMTHVPFGADAPNFTDQRHDRTENDLVESRNHQYVFSGSEKRGSAENEGGKYAPPSGGLAQWPPCSSPEGNVAHFPLSHRIEELKTEQAQAGKTEPFRSPGSPAMSVAFISRERESEKAPESLQDLGQKGSCVGSGKRPREKEKPSHVAAQMGKLPGARPVTAGSEDAKKKQGTLGSGHLAEGVKKKILSRVAALRQKLEEKENVRKNSSLLRKIPKLEKSLSCNDEKKDPEKAPGEREGKAPVLLKKIQAEMLPDHPGNVKLSCQFAEIHEDSTILWTKDSESIAQVQRSAGDNSAVSLAIVQASQKDQGLYYCCIKNSFGKMTAEFNLTAEVLKELSCHPNIKGCEEIEFSQLIFREDFLNDSYFGGCLRGQIATEALHFGEGVHRKAFRSTVMQGLMPVFQPGHACVLKVHNAVAHGTRNNDELIQRNYKLAAQECYVQNTARHYAKIYAAEAQPLEGFGEVPEIIPVFLIRRPESNVPYATVEEELPGEFVKYSIRDGKEINFSRRDSEAGQKCCTFQHWVYQRTSGCLLVTDMQGVGMKLTDVGIATLAKGYKGFKGNCSMTFIDQFKALHQCNKYCKMLGLKSLQNNNQKQKKPSIGKSKVHTNSATVKKPEAGTPAEKKTYREHVAIRTPKHLGSKMPSICHLPPAEIILEQDL